MFTKIAGLVALVSVALSLREDDGPLTLEEAYHAKRAASLRKEEKARQARAAVEAKALKALLVAEEAARRRQAAVEAKQAAAFDREVRKSMGL